MEPYQNNSLAPYYSADTTQVLLNVRAALILSLQQSNLPASILNALVIKQMK